ncbi:HelD family protein [Nocardiopsis potens]|uniref:HelD family protein n=1 Tax=Nocardiopsis potens TaxID=1246458 RepID=UPI000349D6D8|nr:ATP-binding domain-containing protein [Nocardiopsis potens]
MPESAPTPDSAAPAVPGELAAERARLDAARDALRRMREDVLATETPEVFGDWVSTQVLRQAREMRAEALADLPGAPLFFGRLDFEPGTVFEDGDAQDGDAQDDGAQDGADRVRIGRRHVHDQGGRAMVLDWRAPISRAFYQAVPASPMRVRGRRRYGFGAGGELTAFEDEDLTAGGPGGGAEDGSGTAEGGAPGGGLLAAEIERPRTGPMRDIVATIQPEQDDLVRAPLETTLCVQGAPGTGKTAVGLHRIAYLLYTERQRLARSGVAIVGPNRSFLSYIRNVLPALGEVNVGQTTLTELLGIVPVRRTDTAEAARVKGDARMAEVIRRDLWSLLREPEEAVVVQRGARRWRVHPEDLRELTEELRERGVAYESGRGLLEHRIAHAVLTLIEAAGEACDDRTHDQVRRNRAVRSAVAAIWPKADPVKLVLGLLTDPDRLARAAEGLLTPEEQEAVLLPGRPRGPKSARWSEADLALIDEAACLIRRPSGLGHIVLDEAQDLSPMQCRALGRRSQGGSMTVLGDIAQGTAPAAAEEWAVLLRHLGKEDGRLHVLDRGYRVPAQIIDFAARLLPRIAPGLGAPVAVRRAPGSLSVQGTGADRVGEAAVQACRAALDGEGSVALIAADAEVPALLEAARAAGLAPGLLGGGDGGEEGADAMEAHRLVCVPASLAKGLEFDTVVVAEPAAIAAAEHRGLNRLYVVLTRAVSRLHVVHSAPLPAELAAAG